MKEFLKECGLLAALGVSYGVAFGTAVAVAEKIADWIDSRKKEKEVFEVPEES